MSGPAKHKSKPRNPLALHPLMKKSHSHTKSNKSERAKGKQSLNKELKEQPGKGDQPD